MPREIDKDDFLRSRLASGDEQALELLFREHFAALKRVAYRIVANNEQAKDLVQEVFAQLWEKRHSLPQTKPLKAYLFRSVINRSLNFVRDHPRLRLVSLDALTPEQQATHPNETSAPLEDHELQALIGRIIGQLPPQCKLAFQLSREEDMSNAEIADYMGISVKGVEKHMTLALKKLRNALAAYFKHMLLFSW